MPGFGLKLNFEIFAEILHQETQKFHFCSPKIPEEESPFATLCQDSQIVDYTRSRYRIPQIRGSADPGQEPLKEGEHEKLRQASKPFFPILPDVLINVLGGDNIFTAEGAR